MDEVLRLPIDRELIILRGQKVLKAEKFDYTLHPESKKLFRCKASEHIPAWSRSRESESPEESVPETEDPLPEGMTVDRETGEVRAEYETVDISDLLT